MVSHLWWSNQGENHTAAVTILSIRLLVDAIHRRTYTVVCMLCGCPLKWKQWHFQVASKVLSDRQALDAIRRNVGTIPLRVQDTVWYWSLRNQRIWPLPTPLLQRTRRSLLLWLQTRPVCGCRGNSHKHHSIIPHDWLKMFSPAPHFCFIAWRNAFLVSW